MRICDDNKCTGCGACKAICPLECITMRESDLIGTVRPYVNEDDCIKCGLCKKVCHASNNMVERNLPVKSFAARSADETIRDNGASGGIASLMYRHMIKQNVFTMGTAFIPDKGVKYKPVFSEADIEWARDSKYVYSDMTNVFDEYKKKLEAGQKCVFIGLPCQVASLKRYLEISEMNLDKILFVDIVCHGTPNFKCLREHMNHIEEKKRKRIDSIHFRQPKSQYNFTCYSSGKKIWSRTMHGDDTYFRGFSLGLFLRENCYNCLYANTHRVSDITLGDYSGLGTIEKFEGEKSQMSVALCNTQRGITWFEELCNEECIEWYARPVKEALNAKGNPQLRHPISKPKHKEVFDDIYAKTGDFEKAAISAMRRLFFMYYLSLPMKSSKKIIKMIIPNCIIRSLRKKGE